jgi:integrase/recombinase XerC
MIKGLFYMVNTIDAFRDYLQKEKKYSPHTVNAYLNDIRVQSFNETHFQETIEDVNYGQIRSWIVALVDGGMSNVSVNRKVSKSDL